MRARGLRKLRRSARRLRNLFASGGLILLYHRVAEVSLDPWSLCVTPRHFAEHLEVLRKHGYSVRLQQMAQAHQDRRLPYRSVAITFDDGYADNLYNAKPLLERYDIPATIFLTTGYMEHEREFWWDELDRLLLQPGLLPEVLDLRINSSTYQWKLGEAAHYSEEAYQRARCWSAMRDEHLTSRHSLYCSLYQLLRPLYLDERRKVLDELVKWAGAALVKRPTYRCLSSTEVFTLSQGGLIEVGSHTLTHPFLSTLPVALQRKEIQQNKTHLEEIIGQSVNSFAYPHGDYTAETIALVREAKFAYACSTVADMVWRRTDQFQLPRVVVEDWDGEEFARRLSEWLYS